MNPSLFSQQRSRQSTSTLLSRLSLEVRRIIYRQLLRPSPARRAIGQFTETDLPHDRPSLSAQLLWCCQQLYVECRDVLYGENRLRIELQWDNVRIADQRFDVTSIQTPEFVTQDPTLYHIDFGSPDLDLYGLGAFQIASSDSYHYLRARSSLSSWLSTTLAGLMRMRHVDLYLTSTSRREVWSYVRLLRNVVNEKQVRVHWAIGEATNDRVIDLLRCFYLWRCFSLAFEGLPAERPIKRAANTVIDLVTSEEPVRDLFLEVFNLYIMVEHEPALASSKSLLAHNYGYSSDEELETDGDKDEVVTRRKNRRHERELSDVNDPFDLWRIIRRGDTNKFSAWKKRFLCNLAKQYAAADGV